MSSIKSNIESSNVIKGNYNDADTMDDLKKVCIHNNYALTHLSVCVMYENCFETKGLSNNYREGRF